MNENTFINLITMIDAEINTLTMNNCGLTLSELIEQQSKLEKLLEVRANQVQLAKEITGVSNNAQ